MKSESNKARPIWLDKDLKVVKIIDQRRLPHEFVVSDLKSVDDVVTAITVQGRFTADTGPVDVHRVGHGPGW